MSHAAAASADRYLSPRGRCPCSCTMRILPVPVRDDNYAYLVIDTPSKSGVFVDPYTLSKAQDAAKREGVQKVLGCITTHHHHDREFVYEAVVSPEGLR